MGTPKYLSSDHDPLFTYHQWAANLRILDVNEIKSIPYMPCSHPFIERLIGTVRRDFLGQTLFWNAIDLERKLKDFVDEPIGRPPENACLSIFLAGRCLRQPDGATSRVEAKLANYAMDLFLRGLSSMLNLMNGHRTLRIGRLLLKVDGVALGLVFALIATFRDLFVTADTPGEEENDVSAGAYRGGTLNYRTGKLDDGTDPYGWYGND
jgi:hypothetical protein